MIEKVRIRNYRKFEDVTFEPRAGMNVIVGGNESGKSTVLEALALALTGRVNGRPAPEELNPYWFNESLVRAFFEARRRGELVALPTISIEVFLTDSDEYQQLVGAHNSDEPTRDCPGLELAVEPNPEFLDEIEARVKEDGTALIPTDFYQVLWRTFRDLPLQARPKVLRTAIIDARTVRSTSSVDYHMRQMLSDHLDADEKAKIAAAYSAVKEEMTSVRLADVNTKMSELEGTLDGQRLRLGMDQTAKSSWDSNVVPYVSQLPFSLSGQGQQASVKIALAMKRSTDGSRFVMIEEPENHLSHTNLNRLLNRVEEVRSADQQLFVSTHSSFVINRLGLDSLVLASGGALRRIDDISPDTVRYFRRLPGYDTLRMALADQFVMVEGPSDEILFERFFLDRFGRRPIEQGIDVISMRGLAFSRGLELATLLSKRCAVLRDNDGKTVEQLRDRLAPHLAEGQRELFVGTTDGGATLEPQVINANSANDIRGVLGLNASDDLDLWASNNKTEFALRIADAAQSVSAPQYFADALEFFNDGS
jgi:energy-coupling factor transporter ATP-binding protein EcfA2